MTKFKKAIMLTGAAARISQEVAMFDKLQERDSNPLGIDQKDTILSGFSSGSLNLAALNACFRDEAPLDWKKYYKDKILFPLKSEYVYEKNGFPFIPIFDTTPLRITLNSFLIDTSLSLVKDLPFQSYILTMLKRKGKDKKDEEKRETLWANSRDELQEYLFLSDVLMSSTAIPAAFPSQEIYSKRGYNTDFPERKYRDGGTQGTFENFEEHIGKLVEKNGILDEMYIISPMRESSDEEIKQILDAAPKELKTAKKSELSDFLSHISMKTFMKFLVKLKTWTYEDSPMAKNIYVCIPEMESNYPILDFDEEEAQYNAVRKWVDKHPEKLAIPLADFIAEHKEYV